MAAAAIAIAAALDTQTRLTVIAGTWSGMPALSSAWRAVFWPRPAWMTLPKMTSSSCSPLTPALSRASFMTSAPSSCAGVSLNPPWNLPWAVRTAERMTISVSDTVASLWLSCASADFAVRIMRRTTTRWTSYDTSYLRRRLTPSPVRRTTSWARNDATSSGVVRGPNPAS